MKAVMLMFDSLNKQMLSAYGCQTTITPNFERLRKRTLKFDNFYVGSMPCMPARRELHTGRYNFLHRSWGPIEPFDESMPEILKKQGIHTHLVTDHKHYWRDGGATYHSRFSTYEFIRGQEGDNWKGVVNKPVVHYESGEPEENKQRKIASRTQHLINQKYMQREEDHPLVKTINHGIEFIETNQAEDNWFLQLECFDPHEPFYVPEKYLQMYGLSNEDFDGWPPYYLVTEDESQQKVIRGFYQALVTMVDEYVGRVLDMFDKYNLWQDTMLIVNTDHGFLLGEHEWWGKNIMPLYNEIANTPFFIYHPTINSVNESRKMLAQPIDIPATLLDYFHVPIPKNMHGKSLIAGLEKDSPIREYALFGYHGCQINITDGEFVYMRSPVVHGTEGLNDYTLMPTRINRRFTPKELQGTQFHEGFDFTQGCGVLKIPATSVMTTDSDRFGHRLYNVLLDPQQTAPILDIETEYRLLEKIRLMMIENDAPFELYERYGLSKNDPVAIEQIVSEHQQGCAAKTSLDDYGLAQDVKYGVMSLLQYMETRKLDDIKINLFNQLGEALTKEGLITFIIDNFPSENHNELMYRVALEMRLK
ncbi:MAG: sulfatase [Providencia heimbachae]|nr:sulfatase [Providencia heimbachae]